MARNVRIQDMDLGYGRILANLGNLNNASVEVGIFEEAGTHPGADGASVAQVGAWNEYGTETTPERSFMRTTYDQHEARFSREAAALLGRVIDGTMPLDSALQAMGAIQASEVKATINDWTSPPNAPSTVKAKGKNDPLVDSRTLRDSIQFKKHV